MLTTKQLIKLSALIGKMELTAPDIKKGQAQVGIELILQMISKAYLAEEELYAFIADMKGCTLKEAENVDLLSVFKEVSETEGMNDFFQSAIKSQLQE